MINHRLPRVTLVPGLAALLIMGCASPTLAPTLAIEQSPTALVEAPPTAGPTDESAPASQITAAPSLEPPTVLTAPPFVGDAGARPTGAVARLGIGHFLDADLAPDGTQIAFATTTGLYVYQLDGLAEVWRRTAEPLGSVAWSPDGTRLLTVGESFSGGRPALWDAQDGHIITYLEGAWRDADWSPDGTLIGAILRPPFTQGQPPGGVAFYDGATGERQWDVLVDERVVLNTLHWLPDSPLILAESYDGTFYRLDVEAREIAPWLADQAGAYLLYPAPDGSRIAGFADGGVGIWDAASGEPLALLDLSPRTPLAWSPDGARLALVLRARYGVETAPLVVVDGSTGVEVYRVAVENYADVAWLEDGTLLAVTDSSGTVLLDARDGSPVMTLRHDTEGGPGYTPLEHRLIWLPGGDLLTVHSQEVIRWNLRDGQALDGLRSTLRVKALEWSSDGRVLVLFGEAMTYFWDVAAGVLLDAAPAGLSVPTPDPYAQPLYPEQVSPDGTLEAYGLTDPGGCGDGPFGGFCGIGPGELRIRQVGQLNDLLTIAFDSGVLSLDWSPDGRWVAVGLGNSGESQWYANGAGRSQVVVIDVATGAEVYRFTGHNGNVEAVAFSPDGRTLASASRDATVILWSTP